MVIREGERGLKRDTKGFCLSNCLSGAEMEEDGTEAGTNHGSQLPSVGSICLSVSPTPVPLNPFYPLLLPLSCFQMRTGG